MTELSSQTRLESGRNAARSLIDEYLPTYDWSERHSLRVLASPIAVYDALRTADFARSPVVRALLGLRGLPTTLRRSDWLTSRGPTNDEKATKRGSRARGATLDSFRRRGFAILDERSGEELLIGLVGRFWTMEGGICETDAERFRGPLAAGTARAAWNFTIIVLEGGESTLLTTETRIEAADDAARRSFARYWLVIRPFSGLIRRLMLRAIRDEAESAESGGRRQ